MVKKTLNIRQWQKLKLIEMTDGVFIDFSLYLSQGDVPTKVYRVTGRHNICM
jgi:hypothetical protein